MIVIEENENEKGGVKGKSDRKLLDWTDQTNCSRKRN